MAKARLIVTYTFMTSAMYNYFTTANSGQHKIKHFSDISKK